MNMRPDTSGFTEAAPPPARPARICFPFTGDDVGGSHVSALKLIEGLDRSAFEPVIALHQTEGLLAEHLRREGHTFVPAPHIEIPAASEVLGFPGLARAGLSYTLSSLPKLRRFLHTNEIDIVHTNDGRIHALWSPATIGTPVKLVWHHRGDPQARAVNLLAPFVADHLVTVSRFAYPRRPVRSMADRWSVIHSPFEHPDPDVGNEEARRTLRDELGLGPDARLLGYFGSLIERKRPQMMAGIVRAYLDRHPGSNVHAVLFGRPAPDGLPLDEATREHAAELGIADRVHLMGHRSPVEPWMRAVDLLLVPAVNEPFGRTLIEAMMLGVPVIATRHGGNPEAIENGVNGYLVEPEDPGAFVNPIHELLNDRKTYDRIAATARDSALHEYGQEIHVARVSAIYRQLLET